MPEDNSEVETPEQSPTFSKHKAATNGHHTKEDGEARILLFFFLVDQPKGKAADNGHSLHSAGHTATEADM